MNQHQQQQRSPGTAGRARFWLILAGPFVVMVILIVAGLIWRIKAPGSRLQYMTTHETTNAANISQSPQSNPPAIFH